MNKKDVAKILEEIATLLELEGENPFKIRAYHYAAHSILNMDHDLNEVIEAGRLGELEGIGSHIEEKVTTLVKTGHLPYYEDLKKKTPPGLILLMRVHGLGAKKIKTLYEKLKIDSIESLKEACEKDKVSKLFRFGPKTQQKILNALAHHEAYSQKHLWWNAVEIAKPILEGLKKLKEVQTAEIAGSIRRKLEVVGDIDFVVASSKPKPIMKWFTNHPLVEEVLGQGETKASVRLANGHIQADLRIVPMKQFGFALCYFTGSKDHDIRMRKLANNHGWSLSEWGLVSEDPAKKGPLDKLKRPVTEEDIYKVLGLSYILSELRENREEFAAAAQGKLPVLVEESDIRGVFHVHTAASDGRNTLEEMVKAAETYGWEYVGISDHSKSSFQANGLSEEQLEKQIEKIKSLNASKKCKPYIFAGIECDILTNGKLDYSDAILKELDFVIASVHRSLQQDEKTMTKRLIRAIENPYATMLGHMTGRLLLKREPSKVNMNKVIDACIANGKIIELNANPQRLDMDWRYWHAAAEKGLLCSINPDAHAIDNFEFVQAGVNIARKGWLEKKHILNTRSLKEVKKFLKK